MKLIAPQHVKPYIKRNKNDGRDAEGLCEAMSRPTMQFVPVKSRRAQAALMLAGMRERLVARRTQLSNAIRGYAAEFGVTAARGLDEIEPCWRRLQRMRPCRSWRASCLRFTGRSMCNCRPN